MLEKKEVGYFVIAGFIIGYLFAFKDLLEGNFLKWLEYGCLGSLIVFITSFICEIAASRFGCDAEFRLWMSDIRLAKKSRFQKTAPWFIPVWLIVPVALVAVTWGYIKWLAIIVFDAVPSSRVHKRFVDLTEWELALIASTIPFTSLLIAVIAQLAGWKTFAMMSVLYALFNLVPFHELTGTKIFFGSMMLWIFAAIFTIAIFILIGIAGTTGQMFTVLIAAAIIAIVAVILFYLFHEAR